MRIFEGKWRVGKVGWPYAYETSYCTYRKNIFGKTTILDVGLTKEQAEEICKDLNR